MAYSAQADLITEIGNAKLIQLTDDANAGAINSDMVTWAIAEADALIDGYCAARYKVSFSPVPALVKKLSVTLAKCELYLRRQLSDQVEKDRGWAISTLEQINKGTLKLETDSVPVDESSNTGEMPRTNINEDDFPRAFTNLTLKGFCE